MLEHVPSAGRVEIRLDLLAIEGVEAGRARFQRLVTDIVRVEAPGARDLHASPGDWGIDTFVGELDRGRVEVWQSKYFTSALQDSQKAQIRSSLITSLGRDCWNLTSVGTLF